ncbi:hypothetical protein MYMA111404_02620 [Mycoplasma marinum]|uniref:ABC transporter substrate-binding protein n=1 Tax=Mycoplasma marinum TaxID=1937190 RepID=A0A4R0XRP1_9MOLU|nr:hypothetical protein [Mycoplasma marinum]TCG11545.1 hypothetical protein C4B24_01710 [Mycoplasma marinum]
MKKNTMKMRKISLSLLATVVIAAPVVAATSCGGFFAGKTDKASTIRFGMRAEDTASWAPIIKAFENKYEKIHKKNSNIPAFKIKTVILSDQKAQYSMGDVPTVTSIDPNTADSARKNSWFMDLDPVEFLGNKANDKYKLFDDQKGMNFKVAGDKTSDFFEASFQPYQRKTLLNGHPRLVGIPYQYGPSNIYMNNKFIDHTKKIHIYLPNNNAKATGAIDAVDTGIIATQANIKKFILESGRKDNPWADLNNLPSGGKVLIKDAEKLKTWSGYGAGNMYQRIASLSLSTIADNANIDVGWSHDVGFAFEIISSATKGLMHNGQMDDEILKKIYDRAGAISGPNDAKSEAFAGGPDISDTFRYLFDNYYGYYKHSKGYAVDPAAASEAGEAELMWKQKAAYLLGKKWSGPLIKSNWTDEATNPEKELLQLPVPYGSANMDGLGIASGTNGAKLIASKKFIKLAMSMHKDANGNPFSYLVSRDVQNKPNDPLAYKAVPTARRASKYIQDIAKNSKKSNEWKEQFLSPFGMGKNDKNLPSDPYNGVGGFFAASSTDGLYQIYNDNISGSIESWQKSNNGYLTMGNLIKQLKKGIDQSWSEIDNA